MSLVAHYKLNDNAANTAVVASVGTNGTLVGGNTTAQLHVAGKISGALNFDGTSDYVNIGLQSFNAAAGSICAWFKADDYTPATDRNIVARNAAGNVAGDFLIRLRASDSKLIGQIQDGVSSFNAYSNSALADTNWHWLLFTWSAVETALYLDNVKQSVPALGTTLAAHPTVGMAIGSGYNAGASLCWDGLIDDVRIYTHVLTALERAFIYNSGAGTEAVYVPPSFSVSESIVVNEISTFRSSRIRGDFADGAILSDSASFLIKPPWYDLIGTTINPACCYVGESVNELTNLGHLEGQTVAVLANGEVLDEQIVVSGTIDLGDRYSKLAIGLPYESDLETLKINVAMQNGGTVQGARMKVGNVTFHLRDTKGGQIGPDEDSLYDAFAVAAINQYSGKNIDEFDLYTGKLRMPLGAQYGYGGHVFIRQSDPLPLTVGSIMPEVDIGGISR